MWIGDVFGFECVEIIKKSWQKYLGFWGTLFLGQYSGFLIYLWFLIVDGFLLVYVVTV